MRTIESSYEKIFCFEKCLYRWSLLENALTKFSRTLGPLEKCARGLRKKKFVKKDGIYDEKFFVTYSDDRYKEIFLCKSSS